MVCDLDLFFDYGYTLGKVVMQAYLACQFFEPCLGDSLGTAITYKHTDERKYARYNGDDYTFSHVTPPQY